MLALRNSEVVRREAVIRPVLEKLAAAIAPTSKLRSIQALQGNHQPKTPWLVFKDARGDGLALWTDDLEACATPLRRAIVHAQHARRISLLLGGPEVSPVFLEDDAEPPAEWSRFDLKFNDGRCVCACPERVAELRLDTVELEPKQHMLRVAIVAEIELLQGQETFIAELRVKLPEISQVGFIRISKGGYMTLELDDSGVASNTLPMRVRVELGEIELELRDLLSLRPGSVLDIGAASPIVCSLAVGSSKFLHGILEPAEGGFMLRVKALE